MKYIKTFENFDSHLNEEFIDKLLLTSEQIEAAKEYGEKMAENMTEKEGEGFLQSAMQSGVELDIERDMRTGKIQKIHKNKTIETLVAAANNPNSIEGIDDINTEIEGEVKQNSSYTYINEGIISYLKGLKGKIIDKIFAYIINPIIAGAMGWLTKVLLAVSTPGAYRDAWEAGIRKFVDSWGLTGFAPILMIFITVIFALYALVRLSTSRKALFSGSDDSEEER